MRRSIVTQLAGIFLVLFSMNILNTKVENPKLHRFGLILIVVNSMVGVLNIIGLEWFAIINFISIPPVLGFCFYLAAKSAYSGYRPAYAMMMGWSGILLAFALIVIQLLIVAFPNMAWAPSIAFAFEISTFSFAMGQKLRLSELKFTRENEHAFNQLKKMVYPHQLNRIRSGEELEQTMPTTSAQACVLSFDIIDSSKIQHVNAKRFFRNTFTRCNEIISEGYDGKSLKLALCAS
jgi:hypothetical protein